MPNPKLPIPFADYCRIFQVIHSVLDGRANVSGSCMFFAATGAMILKAHYKIGSWPVGGAAAYMLDAKASLVATFGKIEHNMLVSAPDAFHCWVQCGGYAIDFMAPLFPDKLKAAGISAPISRKMFQRPLTDMASSFQDLAHEGAFALLPDARRTRAIPEYIEANACAADLAHICCHWYRPPPERISETLDIVDNIGQLEHLQLSGPRITGVW
jgi:Protein of unknown function (DUF2026)